MEFYQVFLVLLLSTCLLVATLGFVFVSYRPLITTLYRHTFHDRYIRHPLDARFDNNDWAFRQQT